MADPIVSYESVAAGLGLEYPLTDGAQGTILEQTVEATAAKVALFLNRDSLVPELVTLTGLYADARYTLSTKEAWPEAFFDDRYTVRSYVANADDADLYDVTFAVGLDAANDPAAAAIRTFIREDSVTALSNNPLFTATPRLIKSVSADGQSISYAEQTGRNANQANSAIAGAQITLADLKRFKRMPIFQRHTPSAPPWPYSRGYGRTWR